MTELYHNSITLIPNEETMRQPVEEGLPGPGAQWRDWGGQGNGCSWIRGLLCPSLGWSGEISGGGVGPVGLQLAHCQLCDLVPTPAKRVRK